MPGYQIQARNMHMQKHVPRNSVSLFNFCFLVWLYKVTVNLQLTTKHSRYVKAVSVTKNTSVDE